MTTHRCGTCGTTWTAPVTSCPEGPHDPTQRVPRVQRMIDDPEASFAEVRGRLNADPTGINRLLSRELEPEACRCGRRPSDSWSCGHAQEKPRRCVWGMHAWGERTFIVLGSYFVQHCKRCGERRVGA